MGTLSYDNDTLLTTCSQEDFLELLKCYLLHNFSIILKKYFLSTTFILDIYVCKKIELELNWN